MRKAMVLGVLALAGTLASPAFADEWSGVRLGLNLSSDKLQGDFSFAPLSATENLNSDTGSYGLMGGWGLNKWLAVEAALHGGPQFKDDQAFQPLTPATAFVRTGIDVKGVELTAVGSWWITPKFSIFGRAGMYAWKAEQTVTTGDWSQPESTWARGSTNDTGFDPVAGIGLQTELDGAAVRIEYKYAQIGDLIYPGAFVLEKNEITSLQLSIVWIL